MKPLRGALGQHNPEACLVIAILPGYEEDAQPVAVVALLEGPRRGQLEWHDVTAVRLDPEQMRELEWQSGWTS